MRLALLLPIGLAFATTATLAAADGLDLAPVAARVEIGRAHV